LSTKSKQPAERSVGQKTHTNIIEKHIKQPGVQRCAAGETHHKHYDKYFKPFAA
jgi:hypothetical protein